MAQTAPRGQLQPRHRSTAAELYVDTTKRLYIAAQPTAERSFETATNTIMPPAVIDQARKNKKQELHGSTTHNTESTNKLATPDNERFWSAISNVISSEPLSGTLHQNLISKLRQGISPAHMRGPVWQALSNASSLHLERLYDQLKNEHTSSEYLIQRDVARTFPNTSMFSQQKGQEALARVLRAYSLYDADVGYCQGLAFLVGPLLLNMPEEAAFCVLVRLMDTYGMRTFFTPDMDGLHLSLFQFDIMLLELLPDLHSFLRSHGIQSQMYASQWFLTLFAYIFPLPLTYRIYDIIFIEGPVETILRTSLALLRMSANNIQKLTEFEEIMSYLSSKLTEPYKNDYDAIINDAFNLRSTVTKSKLKDLESKYHKLRIRKEAASKIVQEAEEPASFNSSLNSEVTTTSVNPIMAETIKKRDDSKMKSWFGTIKRARSVMLTKADTVNIAAMAKSQPAVPAVPALPSNNNISGQPKADVQILHQQIEDLVKALSEVQKDNMLLKDKLQTVASQQGLQQPRADGETESSSVVSSKHSYGCRIKDFCENTTTHKYCYCEMEKRYLEAKIRINELETALCDQHKRQRAKSPTITSITPSPTLTRSSSVRSDRSSFSDMSSLPSPSSSFNTLLEEYIPTSTKENHGKTTTSVELSALMQHRPHESIQRAATADEKISAPPSTYQVHPSRQYTY